MAGCLARVRNRSNNNEEAPAPLAEQTHIHPNLVAARAREVGSTLNISEELSTQPVNTTPQAVTIGNSKLIADQRANSIIVLGNREVVVKVEKILDEMDVQAPQVALSTVIGQLTLGNNEEFGVDYFAKYNRRFVGTSRNNTVFSSANNPAIRSLVPRLACRQHSRSLQSRSISAKIIQNVGSGTNIYVAAGNAFAAIVHLLESTNRFKILSRPTVFTSNNKKAIIASGQEVPVPSKHPDQCQRRDQQQLLLSNRASNTRRWCFSSRSFRSSIPRRKCHSIFCKRSTALYRTETCYISGNQVPTIDTKYTPHKCFRAETGRPLSWAD